MTSMPLGEFTTLGEHITDPIALARDALASFSSLSSGEATEATTEETRNLLEDFTDAEPVDSDNGATVFVNKATGTRFRMTLSDANYLTELELYADNSAWDKPLANGIIKYYRLLRVSIDEREQPQDGVSTNGYTTMTYQEIGEHSEQGGSTLATYS